MRKQPLVNKIAKFASIEGLILIFLLGNLIIPSVEIGIGINFITFGSILISFYLILKINKIKVFSATRHYILIVIFMVTSLLIGYLFFDVFQSRGDWFEILRYAQILPFFLTIGFLRKDEFFHLLHLAMIMAGAFVICVFLIQYFDLFFLRNFVNGAYASGSQIDNLYNYNARIVLTGSDPNVGALIAGVFSIYFGIYYLEYRKWTYLLLCGALFCSSLFSQSRTILLAYIIAALVYLAFFAKISIFRKVTFISISVGIFLYIALYSDFQYIATGIENTLQGRDESVNVRIENYYNALEAIEKSLLFGFGPSKASHNSIFDAEYALVLYRYGIIGLLLLMYWYLFRLYGAWRFIRSGRYMSFNYLARFSIAIIVMIFVVMFTNNVLAGYQSISIFGLLGVISGIFDRLLSPSRLQAK